jgi:hypothetical protein
MKPTNALISKFFSGTKFYMLRAVSLPFIKSFPLYLRHWQMLHRFDDSLRAGSRWNEFHPDPAHNVQWKTPDDGQRNCPKLSEFRTRINFEISASLGFIVNKFVTMQGHTNLKFVTFCVMTVINCTAGTE